MNYIKTQMVNAGNMAGSITSSGLDLLKFDKCSIQAVWTGTAPTGTFKLQVSNDLVGSAASVVNWSDYTDSDLAITASGDYIWILANVSYRFIRLVYTRASGDGTLNVKAVAKGS